MALITDVRQLHLRTLSSCCNRHSYLLFVSLSLSACRRSVSPCLSLSVSGRVVGCESFKSFLAWFFRQKPAAPVVRCTQRADEATTDGQTDDEKLVNWDRLFLVYP
jgi:hypothetical protein